MVYLHLFKIAEIQLSTQLDTNCSTTPESVKRQEKIRKNSNTDNNVNTIRNALIVLFIAILVGLLYLIMNKSN